MFPIRTTKTGFSRSDGARDSNRQLQNTVRACYRKMRNEMERLQMLATAAAKETKDAQVMEFARLLDTAVERHQREELNFVRSTPKELECERDEIDAVLRYVSADGRVIHPGSEEWVTSLEQLGEPDDEEVFGTALGGGLLLFRGAVNSKPMEFMVDTGATGNFISRKTVQALHLREYPAMKAARVKIADGTTHASNRCVQVKVRLQNYCQQVELAVVDMDLGVDVILGTTWLQRLDNGKPQLDFEKMSLEFHHRGQKVLLKSGMGHMVVPGASLQTIRRAVNCEFDLLTPSQARTELARIDKMNEAARREDPEAELIPVHALVPSAGNLEALEGSRSTTGQKTCARCWQPQGVCRCVSEPVPEGVDEAENDLGEKAPPTSAVDKKMARFLEVPTDEDPRVEAESAAWLTLYQDILANSLGEVKQLPGYQEVMRQRPRAKIRTEAGASPPFKRAYKMSQTQLMELKRQLDDLLAQGYIRPSSSPYGAPILLVPKADGSWRLVIDYRGINAITVASKYPVPNVSQLMDELAGVKVFSTFDALWGFWQHPMDEEDVEKTAMQTAFGSYEWKVLPMGLKNSPATYQNWMNSLLGHLPFVKVFIDDILVFSRTWEEHREHVKVVLDTLRAKMVVLKAKKAKMFRSSVAFLGHVLTDKGIHPQHDKVKAVRD